MRVQLSEVQGQHKEAMNQLGERATLAAKLQNELSRADKQNQSLSEEVSPTNTLSTKKLLFKHRQLTSNMK